MEVSLVVVAWHECAEVDIFPFATEKLAFDAAYDEVVRFLEYMVDIEDSNSDVYGELLSQMSECEYPEDALKIYGDFWEREDCDIERKYIYIQTKEVVGLE